MVSKFLKLVAVTTICTSTMFANGLDLKGDGVLIETKDQNDEKLEFVISRNVDPECRRVNGADPKMVWGGDYANKKISSKCVKEFLTTAGKISPITISEGIKTYGEVEVIKFIEDSTKNENMLLVDARMPDWYEKFTIPTAQNIPFSYFDPKYADFEDTLEEIGVVSENGKYDFSEAKTLLIFCNGSWCLQSVLAIKNLNSIGYPKDKLLWYRGGMYGWKMLNLTTIEP